MTIILRSAIAILFISTGLVMAMVTLEGTITLVNEDNNFKPTAIDLQVDENSEEVKDEDSYYSIALKEGKGPELLNKVNSKVKITGTVKKERGMFILIVYEYQFIPEKVDSDD